MTLRRQFLGLLILFAFIATPAFGQATALERGSDNMEVLGHLPLGKHSSVTDIELEQDLDRPYAYIGRASIVDGGPKGMDVVDLSNPSNPKVIYRFRLEHQDLLALLREIRGTDQTVVAGPNTDGVV